MKKSSKLSNLPPKTFGNRKGEAAPTNRLDAGCKEKKQKKEKKKKKNKEKGGKKGWLNFSAEEWRKKKSNRPLG